MNSKSMVIQEPSNNAFLELVFQTLKKSRTLSAIGLDVLDVKKERSMIFYVRIGNFLSRIGNGAKVMAI